MNTIRDHRTNPCLWIETKLFDENIEGIGVFAWAVYTVLVRHANNGNQKCSPSQERIALLLNCSRNTVAKAIKTLVDHRLITLEEKDKVGDPARPGARDGRNAGGVRGTHSAGECGRVRSQLGGNPEAGSDRSASAGEEVDCAGTWYRRTPRGAPMIVESVYPYTLYTWQECVRYERRELLSQLHAKRIVDAVYDAEAQKLIFVGADGAKVQGVDLVGVSAYFAEG
jgi:hypothetical protein